MFNDVFQCVHGALLRIVCRIRRHPQGRRKSQARRRAPGANAREVCLHSCRLSLRFVWHVQEGDTFRFLVRFQGSKKSFVCKVDSLLTSPFVSSNMDVDSGWSREILRCCDLCVFSKDETL